MPARSPARLVLLALWFSLGFAASAVAADYAGAISAYRRAHGLPAVQSDSRLGAVAPEKVVAACVHAGVGVTGFRVGRPTLEDLFVSLTGEGFDVSG